MSGKVKRTVIEVPQSLPQVSKIEVAMMVGVEGTPQRLHASILSIGRLDVHSRSTCLSLSNIAHGCVTGILRAFTKLN